MSGHGSNSLALSPRSRSHYEGNTGPHPRKYDLSFGNALVAFLWVTLVVALFVLVGVYELDLLHKLDQSLTERLPSSLPELQELKAKIYGISQRHYYLVVLSYFTIYLFKQIFCLPGLGPLNLLAGSLFGLVEGLVIVSIAAPLGALICYWLSYLLFRSLIEWLLERKIVAFRRKLRRNRNVVFLYLMLLRGVPFSPHWFFNLASSLVGVPMGVFVASAFLGYLPYSYVTVQSGVLLREVDSIDDLFEWTMLLRTLSVVVAAIIPIYTSRWISKKTQYPAKRPTVVFESPTSEGKYVSTSLRKRPH